VTDIDPAVVRERVAAVRERISRAGGTDVELVAVTKTFPVDAIVAVVAAGCRCVGENYAQELLAKWAQLPSDGPRPELHFIGRLQSNKVPLLAPIVDVFQTVDRASVIEALARRAPAARVMVQVNVTDEPQKGGCAPADVAAVVDACRSAGLVVEGLMAIGPLGEPEAARPGFRLLRGLVDREGLRSCSMGMSADLEVAVQEGATHVRVGTALFGHRVRAT
jgi:pyridoxal phosphate enzyme (YggS family)